MMVTSRVGQVWRAEDGTTFLVVEEPKKAYFGEAHAVLMLHLGPEGGRDVQTVMHEGEGWGEVFERRVGWERIA